MKVIGFILLVSQYFSQCPSKPIGKTLSKWSSDFNENSDIYKALWGISETEATIGFRSITDDPSGSNEKVLRIEYKKGARGGKSGLSMYGRPPIDWDSANTIKFCFSVFFPKDFDFFLMGKLPGLFAFDETKSPKNCQDILEQKCWSTRFMWREDGQGEIYPSLDHDSQDSDYMENPKQFGTGPGGLGDSLGRGNFKFVPDKWVNICQEVSISDKFIKVTVDNIGFNKIKTNPVIYKKNIDFQNYPFRGIQFASFFGGSSKYASPKDQYAYFKKFSLEVLN